jgi:high-affinity iron transporter
MKPLMSLIRSLGGFALLSLVAAASWVCDATTVSGAPPNAAQNLRQVAGVLEYIAGDYRGAISDDGSVLAPGEYAEQRSLIGEAEALASQAGLAPDDVLRRQLASLHRALDERQKPAAVAALCLQARELIVLAHGVTLSPETTPSRAGGEQLFAQTGCTTCHGADGSAQTEAASKLTPKPANFLDGQRMAAVSPHRAFHAISFGVAGTAMQAYPQLSDKQRWDLAFYVLSLQHAREDRAAGGRWLQRAQPPGLPLSAGGLAALTDDDIRARLSDAGTAEERADALAYLRADAPFLAQAGDGAGSSFANARKSLASGLDAYRKGDATTGRRLFVSAYLDGFEPHEAALGARDRALVQRVERAMLAVRQAAASNAPAERVAERVREAEAVLASAEHGPSDGTTALLGALTIALREGLEISLLIAALLALVRKRGRPELARFVHTGWMLAVVSGLLTWWALGEVLSGMHRELAEAIASLLAAVLLLGVTHWMLGQLTSKRFMGFVAKRMGDAVNQSAALGILGLSFVAAYREAFEVVLFFKALLLDAGEHQNRVWLGAAIGLALLAAIALVLKRIGQRLPPRPFMLMSSVLLALLAFTLAGKGIRSLQEAALLSMTEVRAPELSWLGVYPTLQGVLVQGCVLLFLLASAVWPWWSARHAADRSAADKTRVPAP